MSGGALPQLLAPATAGEWFPPADDMALADRLAQMPAELRDQVLRSGGDGENPIDVDALLYDFRFWGRPSQLSAYDSDAHVTAILAGRGFGKTRVLSEIAHKLAESMPGSRGALIARTTHDVRATLVKGDSGILETRPPEHRPRYVPNNREVTWPNGTVAHTFTASVPDMLRGPQFHWALCISRGTLIQTGRGLVPIEDVTSRDTVLVRSGRYVPLRTGARLTRHQADVVRITTPTRTLDLTPDHRVATPDGWTEAQDLSPNDIIIGWEHFRQDFQGESYSTARSSTSSETADTTSPQTGSITTARSGRRPTGRSLMDTMSTMMIMFLGTMIWTIWSSWKRRSIVRTTVLRSISTLARWRPSSCGANDRLANWSANGATNCSSLSECEPDTARPSAGTTLTPSDIGQAENDVHTPRTSFQRAWAVIRNLLRRPVGPSSVQTGARSGTTGLVLERVVSIAPAPKQDVFDLTTTDPDFPEFFANGVLVHNCDEGAAWPHRPPAGAIANAWDNVKLATRLGDTPQIFMATTPRRVPMVIELLNGVHDDPNRFRVIRGATSANRHLADVYHRTIVDMYTGTSLARQELGGELIGDIEGALLRSEQIRRMDPKAPFNPLDFPIRIIAIDPSVSDKPRDECGIVVIAATGHRDPLRRTAYVVRDESLHGSPGLWAKRAAVLARKFRAYVVAEDNQGGEMVRMVIRQEDPDVPVTLARSEASKAVRAEPVVFAYERGQVVHVDYFGEYESQLTSWVPGESTYSPDRLDAGVIGLSAALVTQPSGMAGRIRLGRPPASASRRRRPLPSRTTVPENVTDSLVKAAYSAPAPVRLVRESRADRRKRLAERRQRRHAELGADAPKASPTPPLLPVESGGDTSAGLG